MSTRKQWCLKSGSILGKDLIISQEGASPKDHTQKKARVESMAAVLLQEYLKLFHEGWHNNWTKKKTKDHPIFPKSSVKDPDPKGLTLKSRGLAEPHKSKSQLK